MFKILFLSFIYLLVATPLCTLVHELGHAIMPLASGQTVNIKVGSDPSISLELGRLSLQIGSVKPWYGYTTWERTDWEKLALLLGPLFSLVLAVIFFFLSRSISGKQIQMFYMACAGWCFFQFLFTLAPINYPTWLGYKSETMSDGKKFFGSNK